MINNNQILKFTPIGDFLTASVRLVLKEKVDLIDQCSSTIQKIALVALSTLCLVLSLGVSYQIGLNCRVREVKIDPPRGNPQAAGAAAHEEAAADAMPEVPAHVPPAALAHEEAEAVPAQGDPANLVGAAAHEEAAADAMPEVPAHIPPAALAHEEPAAVLVHPKSIDKPDEDKDALTHERLLEPASGKPVDSTEEKPLAVPANQKRMDKPDADPINPTSVAPMSGGASADSSDPTNPSLDPLGSIATTVAGAAGGVLGGKQKPLSSLPIFAAGAASGPVGGAGTADSPLAAVATDVEIDFDSGVYKDWLAIIKDIVVKKNTSFSTVTQEQVIEVLKERLERREVDLTAIQTILSFENVNVELDDLAVLSIEALNPAAVGKEAIKNALLESEQKIINEIIEERILKEQIDVEEIEKAVKYDAADLENLLIFCLKNGGFEMASVVFAIEEAFAVKRGGYLGDRLNIPRLTSAVTALVFDPADLQEEENAHNDKSLIPSIDPTKRTQDQIKRFDACYQLTRPRNIAHAASVFIKKLSFTDDQLRKIFLNAAQSNAQLNLISVMLRLKGKFFFKHEYYRCSMALVASEKEELKKIKNRGISLSLTFGMILIIMKTLRFGTCDHETRDEKSPPDKEINERMWNIWSRQGVCVGFFKESGCFSKVR